MNTTAAAAAFGVTVATIRTWCRIGILAAVKTGGRWVIDITAVARLVDSGARPVRPRTPRTSKAQTTTRAPRSMPMRVSIAW